MKRPGELDTPEAVFQAEPGERTYGAVIGIVLGVGLAAILIAHFAVKFLGGPQ